MSISDEPLSLIELLAYLNTDNNELLNIGLIRINNHFNREIEIIKNIQKKIEEKREEKEEKEEREESDNRMEIEKGKEVEKDENEVESLELLDISTFLIYQYWNSSPNCYELFKLLDNEDKNFIYISNIISIFINLLYFSKLFLSYNLSSNKTSILFIDKYFRKIYILFMASDEKIKQIGLKLLIELIDQNLGTRLFFKLHFGHKAFMGLVYRVNANKGNSEERILQATETRRLFVILVTKMLNNDSNILDALLHVFGFIDSCFKTIIEKTVENIELLDTFNEKIILNKSLSSKTQCEFFTVPVLSGILNLGTKSQPFIARLFSPESNRFQYWTHSTSLIKLLKCFNLDLEWHRNILLDILKNYPHLIQTYLTSITHYLHATASSRYNSSLQFVASLLILCPNPEVITRSLLYRGLSYADADVQMWTLDFVNELIKKGKLEAGRMPEPKYLLDLRLKSNSSLEVRDKIFDVLVSYYIYMPEVIVESCVNIWKLVTFDMKSYFNSASFIKLLCHAYKIGSISLNQVFLLHPEKLDETRSIFGHILNYYLSHRPLIFIESTKNILLYSEWLLTTWISDAMPSWSFNHIDLKVLNDIESSNNRPDFKCYPIFNSLGRIITASNSIECTVTIENLVCQIILEAPINPSLDFMKLICANINKTLNSKVRTDLKNLLCSLCYWDLDLTHTVTELIPVASSEISILLQEIVSNKTTLISDNSLVGNSAFSNINRDVSNLINESFEQLSLRPFEIYNFNFIKYYFYLAENENIIYREVILDYCLRWNFKSATFSLTLYFNLLSKLIDPTNFMNCYDQSSNSIFPPNYKNDNSCCILRRMISKCLNFFSDQLLIESELGFSATSFLSSIIAFSDNDVKFFFNSCLNNFKERNNKSVITKNYTLDIVPLFINKFNAKQRLELSDIIVSNTKTTNYDFELVKQLLLFNKNDQSGFDLNYDPLITSLSKHSNLPALYCICIISSISPNYISSSLFNVYLERLSNGCSKEKYPLPVNINKSLFHELIHKPTYIKNLESNKILQSITEYELLICICNNCLSLTTNILIFMKFLSPILTALGSKKRKSTDFPLLPLVYHLENYKFSKSIFNLTLNESYQTYLSDMYNNYSSLLKSLPNDEILSPTSLIKCVYKGLSRCVLLFGLPIEPNLYCIPDFNTENLSEHVLELTTSMKTAVKYATDSENILIFSKYLFKFNAFFNTIISLESVSGASLLTLLKVILKNFYLSNVGAQIVFKIASLFSTIKTNDLTRKHIYVFITSHSKFSEMIFLENATFINKDTDIMINDGLIISNSIKSYIRPTSVRIVYFSVLNKLLEEDPSLIESGLWDAIRVCYRGSNSEFDNVLLNILQKFELGGFPVFSSSFAYGSVPFAFRYIPGLDFNGWCARFSSPLNSKWLDGFFEKSKLKLGPDNGADCYNSEFALSIFGSYLNFESSVGNSRNLSEDCRKFAHNGYLSYVIMCLASKNEDLRLKGYYIMGQFYVLLQSNYMDHLVFRECTLLIALCASLSSIITSPFEKISGLKASYLISSIDLLFNPADSLYLSIVKSVLEKPHLKSPPDVFHSLHKDHKTHRHWAIKLYTKAMQISEIPEESLSKFLDIVNLIQVIYSSSIACYTDRVGGAELLRVASNSIFESMFERGWIGWLTQQVDHVVSEGFKMKDCKWLLELVSTSIKKLSDTASNSFSISAFQQVWFLWKSIINFIDSWLNSEGIPIVKLELNFTYLIDFLTAICYSFHNYAPATYINLFPESVLFKIFTNIGENKLLQLNFVRLISLSTVYMSVNKDIQPIFESGYKMTDNRLLIQLIDNTSQILADSFFLKSGFNYSDFKEAYSFTLSFHSVDFIMCNKCTSKLDGCNTRGDNSILFYYSKWIFACLSHSKLEAVIPTLHSLYKLWKILCPHDSYRFAFLILSSSLLFKMIDNSDTSDILAKLPKLGDYSSLKEQDILNIELLESYLIYGQKDIEKFKEFKMLCKDIK